MKLYMIPGGRPIEVRREEQRARAWAWLVILLCLVVFWAGVVVAVEELVIR